MFVSLVPAFWCTFGKFCCNCNCFLVQFGQRLSHLLLLIGAIMAIFVAIVTAYWRNCNCFSVQLGQRLSHLSLLFGAIMASFVAIVTAFRCNWGNVCLICHCFSVQLWQVLLQL